MKLSDKQKVFFKIFLCLCIYSVFIFLAGCSYGSNMTCSILSLKSGYTVTIQKKFHDIRLNFLESSSGEDSFFLITGDPEKKHCYIMQYNMQGEKHREYKLPFFTHSILTYGGDPRCAFYPAQKRIFHVENVSKEPQISQDRLFYYDLDSGTKGMISGIDGKDFAITGLYVLDENLLLVNSSCNTARKGFLYLVNIKEKKLAAMQEIPSPAQVAVNIPLSQFSVFQAYNKKIDVYDLRTLKHLFAIPECPDLYVTNCAFSPSGNVMLQGGFGDDRDEICLFVARNNRWEFAGRIFGVSTKEYFILDPNFYSDQIILFLLSKPNRSTPKQLCFFDLREKKIVKKYPAPVWGYSKRQGDYLIWED